MLKWSTTKVRLGFYIVQKAKIRYSWGFTLFKMLKQGTVGIVENAKVRYGQSTTGVLYCSKSKT